MVKYYFIAFIFLAQVSYAQTNYEIFKGKPVKTVVPTRLEEPYFCEYKDTTYNPLRMICKADFTGTATPENLILSAYCGSINELATIPRYSGSNPDTTERNGIILIHKLTFLWQGTETSIVKFSEMKDSVIGKSISVQLQKSGNTWQQVNIDGINNIENVLSSIRTNLFWEFYHKKSDNPAVSTAYMKVKDEEGLLNIDLLSDYINQLRKSDPATYSGICDN